MEPVTAAVVTRLLIIPRGGIDMPTGATRPSACWGPGPATDLPENLAVIRAAVSLAHLMGLEVVAEGIETELQEAVALESGCDLLQGHRYGIPVPAEQFEGLPSDGLPKAA